MTRSAAKLSLILIVCTLSAAAKPTRSRTIFSLDPLRPRLKRVGLSDDLLSSWYARTLRDTAALAATDTYVPFADMLSTALTAMAAEMGLRLTPDQVASVMAGLRELPPADDVRPALEKLKRAGVGVALYSQGSPSVLRHLVDEARLADVVDHLVSCDDVQALKPLARGYHHAAAVLGHAPAEVMLVAAHSWDCHGAKRAGLTAGWVRRQETRPNPRMEAPDVQGDHLVQVANRLLAM